MPPQTFLCGEDRVEVWADDDFDPWETLRWNNVRALFYRQHKPNGELIEAFWLTDFSSRQAGPRSLYRMAKSRWEIENQGFHDAKNRLGLEQLCHHESNSILMGWLLIALALTIERLYRLRYLHRGTHPISTAIQLVRLLWLSLVPPRPTGIPSLQYPTPLLPVCHPPKARLPSFPAPARLPLFRNG